MNPMTSIRRVFVFAVVVVGGLRADGVAPQLVNSPQAQRIRDLTLIGGSTERPSPELVAAKVRLLVELAKTIRAKLSAIDARAREAGGIDQVPSAVREEREALLKRESEVSRMLKQAMLKQAMIESDTAPEPTTR